MATSIEPSEKGGQIDKLRSSTLLYGENLMKIGPVDPELPLLKCLFLKGKKEINASRTHSIAREACMPHRAKLALACLSIANDLSQY